MRNKLEINYCISWKIIYAGIGFIGWEDSKDMGQVFASKFIWKYLLLINKEYPVIFPDFILYFTDLSS